jgi:hypothetical protein
MSEEVRVGHYWLAHELIDTHVQHIWRLGEGVGPEQLIVYWIRPGYWVVEVEDDPESASVPDGHPIRGFGHSHDDIYRNAYIYRVAEADALAMLARHGHGPNIWNCPCEPCRCVCGESFHTHPLLFLEDGAVMLGTCTRLHLEGIYAHRTRMAQEWTAKRQWSAYDRPPRITSSPALSAEEGAIVARWDREQIFLISWHSGLEVQAMHAAWRSALEKLTTLGAAQAREAMQARLTQLDELIDERDARMWEHDPERARDYLAQFYAQHPDGTPDWSTRLS